MHILHRMSRLARKFLLPLLVFGFWHATAQAEQIDPQMETTAPPVATVDAGVSNPTDVAADQPDARGRLQALLNPELATSFRLFVYVNKAANGPGAQRMSVFARDDDGQLVLLHDWPVSTGRERVEQDTQGHAQSSVTPTGYFEIDSKRVYLNHLSGQWHEPMPYAMFFAQAPGGRRTGLAIHGTDDTQAGLLGTRASAGCVRLSLENAESLFTLLRSELRGPTPLLARVSGGSAVANPANLLAHDRMGRPLLTDGYSVLIVIDDSTPPLKN